MAKIQVGKLNISIKKRTLPQFLMLYVFALPLLFSFLLDFLGVASIVKYTVDACWVLTVVLMLLNRKGNFSKDIVPIVSFIALFFLYTLSVYAVNFQSIYYYLWGFRNNFRFYFAFLGFAMFFCEEDANACLKLLDLVFWINAIVSFVQYFYMGYSQDFLGGIFGVEKGCNAYSIIFFSVVISKSILQFMNNREGILSCIAKCGVALLISALAELKFFFIVFLVIILMSAFLTKFSLRKFVLLFFAAMLMIFASSVLSLIFGSGSELTLENIFNLSTSSNYSGQDDLGRFSAISTISKTFLTDLKEQLFGMGLGNCDTSSFSICNTPFYRTYSDLHYTWLLSAFLFLETGYIGLIMYFLFFAFCFVFAAKNLKSENANHLFCKMAMIISVLCMLLVFYNASLRSEAGYFAYFALALPFIKKQNQL